MKTNKILMAMALPALLAACTADELVEQPTIANISGRAQLDSNFAIKVVGNADSRFSWDSYKWGWTEDDSFGAAVVDPVTPWTVSDQYMLGNYIHSQNAAGNWITDSQMTEGVYMFYSYDGYELKSNRGLVTFDISSQKADLDEPEALLNDEANQLFFSPLYNVEAEYSSEVLPLEFRSFWGVAAFNFKNSTGQNLKVTQIILKDAQKKFVVKGGINPKALQGVAQYVYNEDEGEYVPTQVNAVLEGTGATEKKIAKAYETFESNLLSTEASIAGQDGVESSFIALDCQNYELANGEEVTAYMLVPAHDGKDIEVDIMVVDKNGEAKVVHVNNSMVSDIKTLDILRDKTNAIFGKTVEGGIKTLKITKNDLADDAGFYVSNNEELKELLDGNHGELKVHNSGDVVIDAEISEAIREYIGTSVTFTQPITIAASEALVDNEEGEVELALDGVIFQDEVTVKGASRKNEINGVVEFNDVEIYANLVVEEGAVVTLNEEGKYNDVESYGSLTVVGDVINKRITVEAGAVTVNNGNPEVNVKAGELSYVAIDVDGDGKADEFEIAASNLTIAAGANLTIGEKVTLTVNEAETVAKEANEAGTAIAKTSTWTNNGTIVLNQNLNVLGKLVNNGTIGGSAGLSLRCVDTTNSDNETVHNGAKMENNEGAEVMCKTITVGEHATVLNGGEFGETQTKALVNDGVIEMDNFDARVTITSGTGEVDNTAKGVVDAPDGMMIYAKMPSMTNLEEIEKYGKSTNINKLVITGKWTLTYDKNYASNTEPTTVRLYKYDNLVIKEIEFDGGSLSVDEDLTFDFAAKVNSTRTPIEIVIAADTEWKGRLQKTSAVKGISKITREPKTSTTKYELEVSNLNVDVTIGADTMELWGDYYFASDYAWGSVSTVNANGHKMILASGDYNLNSKTVNNATLTSLVEASAGFGKAVVKLTSGNASFNGCHFEAPTTQYDINIATTGTVTIEDCYFETATNGVEAAGGKAAGKRALYISAGATLDVKNTVFDDKVYAFNSNSDELTASFEGGELNGWMSGHGNYTFKGVTFGRSGEYADFIPYNGWSTFDGCYFNSGFEISTRQNYGGLVFKNGCKYAGNVIEEPEDIRWSTDGDGEAPVNCKKELHIEDTKWYINTNGETRTFEERTSAN